MANVQNVERVLLAFVPESTCSCRTNFRVEEMKCLKGGDGDESVTVAPDGRGVNVLCRHSAISPEFRHWAYFKGLEKQTVGATQSER